jgi:hypothetical protein
VGLAAFLVAPACAAAGGPWAVKNADGRKIGTVRTVSSTKAVFVKSGRDAGEMNRRGRGKWTAFGFLHGGMDAAHVHHAALWGKSPAWQLRGFAEYGPLPLIGRIVRRRGRLVVQAGNGRNGWKTRGTVTRACPVWAAGGAVYLMQTQDAF